MSSRAHANRAQIAGELKAKFDERFQHWGVVLTADFQRSSFSESSAVTPLPWSIPIMRSKKKSVFQPRAQALLPGDPFRPPAKRYDAKEDNTATKGFCVSKALPSPPRRNRDWRKAMWSLCAGARAVIVTSLDPPPQCLPIRA